MIFTWQNLGQTNVNYSISLIIGNIQAVNAPLINITRSGLIPKHEQVFKITLPCSGKLTDEVDVQVLINIVGAPAPDEPVAAQRLEDGPESAQLDEPAASDRLVSHTLAIKRKKICTMHPVQVPVQPRPTLAQPQPAAPVMQPAVQPHNRWPEPAPEGSAQSTSLAQPQAQPTLAPSPSPARPPAASHPALVSEDPFEANTRKLEQVNLIQTRAGPETTSFYPNWPRPGRLSESPLADTLASPGATPSQQMPGPQSGATTSPLVLSLTGLSLLVSAALVLLVLLGSAGRRLERSSPLDKLGAFTSGLIRKTSPAANKCKRSPPMMPVTISGTLRTGLKSASHMATLAPPLPPLVGAGGGSSSGSSSSPASSGQKSPSYWFKPASGCANPNQYLHHYQQQHQQHQHQQQQQQHHHYQQPPTADLLGASYLCGQPMNLVAGGSQTLQHHLQHGQAQCPIYHIATNNSSQTTRLIWTQANGVSPDGFPIEGGTYMPLSNAGCSETENVYQKIY